MRWVNVRRFQGADLFTTKCRVVGHPPASPGCAAALVCKLPGWSATLLRLESTEAGAAFE